MNGRTVLGSAFLLVGLVVIGTAVVDLADDSRGATGTRATAGAGTPGAPATPVPSPTPTPSPELPSSAPPSASAPPSRAPSSPDPFTRVSAFYSRLIPAIRDTDADTLVSVLHPATIERYSRAACRAAMASLNDPTFDVIVHGVRSPGPWDYTTDAVTTQIAEAITVDASITANGATEARELHLAMVDGEVRWFTDCGTPQP